MLTLDTRDVTALRGSDGQAFVRFVDALLRAELAAAGIAQRHIQTNQKNQGDGGVDTAVDVQLLNDLTGYLGAPTCWQYKAKAQQRVTPAGVAEEINKPRAAELIRQGYAWRLAIADEVSHGPRQALKIAADDAIRAINPNAPEALIVTASDLASWASRYAAVVLHVSPPPSSTFLDHRAQKENIQQGATPIYVDIPSWASTKRALRAHCDLAQVPSSPVLTVQGEAGVGKTRLVCETLSELENVQCLSVYTENAEAAEAIAHHLARAQDAKCILVVDECSPDLRALLERTMQGSRTRCRVIALDNSGTVASRASIEAVLPKMGATELASVLSTNFPNLPKDRQRAYADAAQGYPRLAADLCAFDPLCNSSSLQIPGGIELYVQQRLTDRRMAIEAVSLVWRCGHRDQLSMEFRDLCAWLKIDEAVTRAHLKQIKDRPGFVKNLGRYAYVTPDLVAQLGFRWAWQRWAEDDVAGFLKTVPDSLLDSFLKRVQHSGDGEVRRRVGEYFHNWLASLTVDEIQDAATVKRAMLIVEADVATCLPVLEQRIDSMSVEDLRGMRGSSASGWGPRRHLVWLLEQVARLPDCLRASEAILRRLAVAESEPDIGNNATAIYRQLFRVYGSGTATPYLQRIELLKQVIETGTVEERALAISAIGASLAMSGFRLVGRTFVAGRLPPNEWQPSTPEEHVDAWRACVGLLVAATQNPVDEVRDNVIRTLVSHARSLLAGGFLVELQSSLTKSSVLEQHGSELLREIDAFMRWDAEKQNPEYVEAVRAWASSVAPDDLRGRLVRYVGRVPSVLTSDPHLTEWTHKLTELALELVADSVVFATQIAWLSSDKAGAAASLGVEIGKLDARGDLLELVIETALKTTETGFARGYCSAYTRHSPESEARLCLALDRIEDAAPGPTYEISLAVEPIAACVRRIRRLVAAGKLSVAAEAAHRFKYGSEQLAEDDAVAVIGDLLDSARRGDSRAVREVVDMLAGWISSHGKPELASSPRIRACMWQVAEIAVTQKGAEDYHWAEILQSLANDDPVRVVRLCVQALLSESFALNSASEAELSRLATSHGADVVAELGHALLDEDRGWVLQAGNLRGLVAALPMQDLQAWLATSGVHGARAIARHLQPPQVTSGVAAVHPLTEHVLSLFEGDDQTFSAFWLGTHSMQMYRGDIAAQHQAEADAARPLLNHPLRRVREWAQLEVQNGEADAVRWRQYRQERETDF